MEIINVSLPFLHPPEEHTETMTIDVIYLNCSLLLLQSSFVSESFYASNAGMEAKVNIQIN